MPATHHIHAQHRRWPFALLSLALLAAAPARAGSYHDIYVFNAPGDGATPAAGVVMDAQGRLYGTTQLGGVYNAGTVFRLTRPPIGNGQWTEEILHSFDTNDGFEPVAPVVLGSDGSVYGTTEYGGSGEGVAFKLTNAPGWPLTVLHNFGKGLQGGLVNTGLLFGPNGLLYGTTSDIGTETYAETGTVYSLSVQGGQTQHTVVHAFGKGTDGIAPVGISLVPLGYFNGFLGATEGGGNANDYGTVFAEKILASGKGQETVLYNFSSNGLSFPGSPPVAGTGAIKEGIYGSCMGGGTPGFGGVYSLVPDGKGGLTESTIYSFGNQPNDPQPSHIYGEYPLLQANHSGVLVGISYSGGVYGDGTFFELDPPTTPGGAWTEKVDISFNLKDDVGGGNPMGVPMRHGSIYYGALTNAKHGNGAIYELTP